MGHSIAILVIGSLIWNEREHRKAWREKHLLVKSATRVQAPIRYGRLSKTKTYTMVFSTSLVPGQNGWALAIPCRCVAITLSQLKEEAEALWAAEQVDWATPGPLAANWGAVALLPNPRRTGLDAITHGWSAAVRSEHVIYERFPHGRGEAPAVTPGGMLGIPWPVTEAGESLDVDFILATATKPQIENGEYPTAAVVAAAWERAGDRSYFDQNRQHGIVTAFDDDILRCLGAAG